MPRRITSKCREKCLHWTNGHRWPTLEVEVWLAEVYLCGCGPPYDTVWVVAVDAVGPQMSSTLGSIVEGVFVFILS